MGVWVRKGEWLEVPAASVPQVPDKLLRRLKHSDGFLERAGKLLLRLFPEESLHCMPQWAEVDVLYEDDFCLVVLKPAGMKVHGTEPGEGGTLDNAVAYHYETSGQACRVRHIHRLDEDTTGPVLYAKNDFAQLVLDAAMREKDIRRTYVALVQGRLREAKGTIDAPIGRDRHHASRRRVSPGGDAAVTHFELLEQYTDASLVRLTLETGRTHQIRVHMSHRGHPLIGDTLYGGKSGGFPRQALHGERLAFAHPCDREPIEVTAPWPEDLLALQASLSRKI